MKKIKKIILGILALIIIILAGAFIFISNGLEAGKNLVVNSVSAAGLEDGTYNGKYDGGRWTNEVNVSVAGGKITKITAVKTVMVENKETTEALFKEVINKQSTAVDVISGATVTCKAYLKSIENALSK